MQNLTKNDWEKLNEIYQGLQWTPHSGQSKVLKAVFVDRIKSVFVQCGRKWGKTDVIEYILWRWAYTNPGSSCYYISPFNKQSKELIWANRRIQNFGPREWIKGINNSELRITLTNDSFIKLDGSDNFDAYRGVEPHLLVMEEYKDHRPEFMEAMRPNLSVYDAPCVFIGTPPETIDNHFLKDAEEHKEDPTKFFCTGSSWDNPYIPRDWLEKEKERLYKRGDGDQWEREYEGRFVRGGANKIFPMLKESFVKPHQDILDEIARDNSDKIYYWPSYEMVKEYAQNPYTDDNRHVKKSITQEIMDNFVKYYTTNNIGL